MAQHGQERKTVEKLITECAERIITVLERMGETDILSLSEYLSERGVITYQALGWLAREGRIDYAQHGSQVIVALRARGNPASAHPTQRRST
jgi:hypothetical protein